MTEPAFILVVEDSSLFRKVLKKHLSEAGYRVDAARDGNQALQAMKTARPDLVLLDLMMPGMDGFEVLRRMRADAELVQVPVFMVTALGQDAKRQEAQALGVCDYITKPYSSKELLEKVNGFLGSAR